MTHGIFVSHSTADNTWCHGLVTALRAAGQDVWYDETHLGGGMEWIRVIEHEIIAREVFVIVVTCSVRKWISHAARR
jgi:hypothetical protein